jgi:metal-dependent hydrolase (beta-lactamase superfamily II)
MTLTYILLIVACSHGEVRSIERKPVEVCVNGIWAGICSNTIDASAIAKILCKQLIGVENSCKLFTLGGI